MNKYARLASILFVSALMLSPLSVYSQTSPESCLDIDNDVARLACFDALFERQKNQSPKAQIQAPLKQTPKASAEVTPKPTAPVERQTQIDDFGSEDLVSKPVQDEIKRIDSVVSSIDENSRGIRTFTLANGQVWREIQSSRLRIKEGMNVFVEKGALSAHFLGKEGANRRIKVNRVK